MFSRRLITVQPDILEWLTSQRHTLNILRKERYKLEKGFVAYFKDIVEFLKNRESSQTSERSEDEKKRAENAERSIGQFYESEELTKSMKWKRVTWNEDADYSSFSKRILDNDAMFKQVPAFSFMSVHIIKDPLSTDLITLPPQKKIVSHGDLTNLFSQEREPKIVKLYHTTVTAERRSAFKVDWSSGNVKILDTASAQEILTFLSTVAPRLQALQVKMEEQQSHQAQDVEKVRVRVGVLVKFNEFDTSFWDDAKRKTDLNYISPDDLEIFLKSMLKSAFLYRWFLKGQQIRVVPPGRSYFVDVDAKEVHIPANFVEYNWLKAHNRFMKIETVFDSFRRFWWVWFSLGMVLIGDVELL
ncbi:unnamed protein product [Phytomonas sp. Hart1]|nr:unnamed protein product [Phytomonas sp. Hart1]|eukprot:CCW68902.1 unnamed protein product [Phytomonas sp. isolate Hart1]